MKNSEVGTLGQDYIIDILIAMDIDINTDN